MYELVLNSYSQYYLSKHSLIWKILLMSLHETKGKSDKNYLSQLTKPATILVSNSHPQQSKITEEKSDLHEWTSILLSSRFWS